MKVPVNNLTFLYDTFLFMLFWNYRNKQFTRAFCVRFLAAASLQGLVQEGTMTSLCIAMTEEQHKSMIIDCSGPQPQLHSAGEITAVISLFIPQPLRTLDIRNSWGYSAVHRFMPRKSGLCLETRTPVYLWGSRGFFFFFLPVVVYRPWNYDFHTSGKLQNDCQKSNQKKKQQLWIQQSEKKII